MRGVSAYLRDHPSGLGVELVHPPVPNDNRGCRTRQTADIVPHAVPSARLPAQQLTYLSLRLRNRTRPRPFWPRAHPGVVYHEAVTSIWGPGGSREGTAAVLSGGLNNMLMHIAQLLTTSCELGAVLLMPPLDADPLRSALGGPLDSRLLSFGELFNFGAFARAVRSSCNRRAPRELVALDPPAGAQVVRVMWVAARCGTEARTSAEAPE